MSPELKSIRLELLKRGQYQPRKYFDPEALQELADSIKEQGIIEPIIVRPLPNHTYEIIAGERRWRAAQLAGLQEVPCLVRDCSDQEAAALTVIENIQRQDLNPIEEAESYQRLIHEFGYSHEEVAKALGKSRTGITNHLRLLKLEPSVKDLIRIGELSEGHGKILASLSLNDQIVYADTIQKQGWSVRKLELALKDQLPDEEPPSSSTDPNVKRVENKLTEKLGSPVKIQYDKYGKGKVTVDFSNYEILQGILEHLGYAEE